MKIKAMTRHKEKNFLIFSRRGQKTGLLKQFLHYLVAMTFPTTL